MLRGIRHSFEKKVFCYMTILIVIVVGFVTRKNIDHLQQTMKRQYQTTLINSTQLIGLKLNESLTRWDTKSGFLLQALLQNQQVDQSDLLKRFNADVPGLVGIEVHRLDPDKPQLLLSNLPSSVPISFAVLKKYLESSQIVILPHPRVPGLGVMYRKYTVRGEASPIGVGIVFKLVSLSPEELNQVGFQSFLLGSNFSDLRLRKSYPSLISQKRFAQKSIKVMKKEIGFGYLGDIEDSPSRTEMVSYYRLPDYPLYLVIHMDASNVKSTIQSFTIEMLMWTLLFVALAVVLAYFMTHELMKSLAKLFAATQNFAAGRFDIGIPGRAVDEVSQLSHNLHLISQKVRDLMAANKDKARVDQEIATAMTVQSTFFKDHEIRNEKLHIISHHIPAKDCGGDWWGRFSIAPGKELVIIGDATGRGVPAALVTAIAYTTVHVFVQEIAEGIHSPVEPSQILSKLNQLLANTLRGSYSMTFIALFFDSETDRLYFSNGGQPFPIFIPAQAQDERNNSSKYPFRFLIHKNKSSNVLGLDPVTEYHNEVFEMKPGDKFIIHSHGLIEVKDSEGRRWGSRGLEKSLKKYADMGGNSLCQSIISEVTQFNEGRDQFADDLTVVVVEYTRSLLRVA